MGLELTEQELHIVKSLLKRHDLDIAWDKQDSPELQERSNTIQTILEKINNYEN